MHTNFLPLTARTRVSVSPLCHLRAPLLGWLLHVSVFSSSLLGTSACSPLSKLLCCPPYTRGSEAICWLIPCCGLRLGRGDLCLVRRRGRGERGRSFPSGHSGVTGACSPRRGKAKSCEASSIGTLRDIVPSPGRHVQAHCHWSRFPHTSPWGGGREPASPGSWWFPSPGRCQSSARWAT